MVKNLEDIKKTSQDIITSVKKSLAECENLDVWQNLKVEFTGKKSKLSEIIKEFSSFNKEEKAKIGKTINITKTEIEKLFNSKKN